MLRERNRQRDGKKGKRTNVNVLHLNDKTIIEISTASANSSRKTILVEARGN